MKTAAEMMVSHGVTARTLRFYEQRGLLSPRRVNQSVLFSPDDELKLHLIRAGKRLGFSLEDLKELLASRLRRADRDLVAAEGIVSLLTAQQVAQRLAILEKKRASTVQALEQLYKAEKRSKSETPDET